MDNIGKEIKHIMKHYNLSREDVASRLGISSMSVWRWVHDGKSPQSRFVLREFESFKNELRNRKSKK